MCIVGIYDSRSIWSSAGLLESQSFYFLIIDEIQEQSSVRFTHSSFISRECVPIQKANAPSKREVFLRWSWEIPNMYYLGARNIFTTTLISKNNHGLQIFAPFSCNDCLLTLNFGIGLKLSLYRVGIWKFLLTPFSHLCFISKYMCEEENFKSPPCTCTSFKLI